MPQYRILALDGGGSWALIQVKALMALYGGDIRGRDVLSKFDLAAANSGGSIVLGCLIEDLTLSQTLEFFNNEEKRKSVFSKTDSIGDQVLHAVLGIGPKYSAHDKLAALQSVLSAHGGQLLSDAVAGIRGPNTPDGIHALIVAFDYDANRAVFFRSATISHPWWGQGDAAQVTVAEAVHASTNAPVNYFDGPATFPNRTDRYWDGAISGCNNPVLAAVSEAIGLEQAPENIVALSLGTGAVALPAAPPGSPHSNYTRLPSETGLRNDLKKLAESILDDPPDAATFVAHLMTGAGSGLPAGLSSRIARMNPLISPVASPPGSADPWTPPGTMTRDQFRYLLNLDMDAVEQNQVDAILQFADSWLNDQARNQPIRMDGTTLKCELGQERFSLAQKAWEALDGLG
jgi:hypothetical protein